MTYASSSEESSVGAPFAVFILGNLVLKCFSFICLHKLDMYTNVFSHKGQELALLFFLLFLENSKYFNEILK